MGRGSLETLRLLTAPSRAAGQRLALARFPSTLWSTVPGGRTWEWRPGAGRAEPGPSRYGRHEHPHRELHRAIGSKHQGRRAAPYGRGPRGFGFLYTHTHSSWPQKLTLAKSGGWSGTRGSSWRFTVQPEGRTPLGRSPGYESQSPLLAGTGWVLCWASEVLRRKG